MSLLKNLRKKIRFKKHFDFQFFRHTSILKQVKRKVSKKNSKISKNYLLRLLKEYLLREKKYNYNTNSIDIWDPIYNNFQKDLKLTLHSEDNEKIENILNNPGSTNLFIGFDNNVTARDWTNKIEHMYALDKLLSFAEFLGIKDIYNPEQDNISVKKIDIEDLLKKIEKKINFKLKFRNVFPGEGGFLTSRGILNEKEIQAIYAAYKISKIVNKNQSILEIGAGLGRTAYYCSLFGIKDYTIVDIPISFLAQGNYLGRVLSEKKIVFENELSKKYKKNKIKLITPEYFLKNKTKYDLILNCDSLTEINYELAYKYMKKIKTSKYFYSINHEKNTFNVSALIKKFKFKYYSRNLYWLRKGYIEEFVKF